jgi:hypothetical protein
MHIFKYVLLVCVAHGANAMELASVDSLVAQKVVLEKASYFTIMRGNMVAIHRGAVMRTVFLSECSGVNVHVQRHKDILDALHKTEKPVVLFFDVHNQPLEHYVFDGDANARVSQFKKLLDPSYKPKATRAEMSHCEQGGTYVALKDQDDLILGAGMYLGDLQAIRERVCADFADHMELCLSIFAQVELTELTQKPKDEKPKKEKRKTLKSLFKKNE